METWTSRDETGAVLTSAAEWLRCGEDVALATVVSTWGSAPRAAGALLAVAASGNFAGSVSGGCVEGAVIEAAAAVITSGKPERLEFGVSDDRAWTLGLACGGTIVVYLERVEAALIEQLLDAYQRRQTLGRLVSLTEGRSLLVQPEQTLKAEGLTAEAKANVRQALTEARNLLIQDVNRELFLRVFAPRPRLVVIGAVHIAQYLLPMAEMAGFDVIVVDPRQAFASARRFPGARLVTSWPDKALQQLQLDEQTAVVTLTHDPKLDEPALRVALASPAFYIGALGSRKTHATRLERLRAAGFQEAQLQRICAPVGLDLGGRSPAEIALAIAAEAMQKRYRQ